MTKSATALASWVRVIRNALDQAGCDGTALLHTAGIDAEACGNPNARLPLAATTRLWRLAVAATGDEAFGLKVASAVKPGTFLVLELSLGASRNLQEVFERIVRYFHVVSDAAELHFQRDGEVYRFTIRPLAHGPQPAVEAIDAFMSLFVRMGRSLLGAHFSPRRIELCRPPPGDREKYHRILRAPLVFNAASNTLVLEQAQCEQPLPNANPELAREGDQVVRRYLARYQRENISAQVQAAITEQLSRGEPAQEDVARLLNLSPRSLQRRLAAQDRSYRRILDDTRRELAAAYLQDAHHSVVEITYLLGYADSSNFSRACRRWFGCSPSAYREQFKY